MEEGKPQCRIYFPCPIFKQQLLRFLTYFSWFFQPFCCWIWKISLLSKLMFKTLLLSEAKDIMLFPHQTHLRFFHVRSYLQLMQKSLLLQFSILQFFLSIFKVQRMSCVGPLSLPHVTTSGASIGRWAIIKSTFYSCFTHTIYIWRFSFPAKSTFFANLSWYSNNPDTFTRYVPQDLWWII